LKKRLQVILAHAGVSSRRKAREFIESGRVRINGLVVREKGFGVDTDIDKIELDGRPLGTEKKVYYILNKPKGVITTSSDEKGRKTVIDLINSQKLRIYPVGRLDKDTEGVLLLTNDGDLAYKLMHPKFEIKKIYIAEIKGEIRKTDLEKMEKGIRIDGEKLAPCQARILEQKGDRTVVRIRMHEGRKREIRKMFEEIGSEVVNLRRIEYAGLNTKGLGPGEYRHLTTKEILELKNAAESK